jgi:hypothetical protein
VPITVTFVLHGETVIKTDGDGVTITDAEDGQCEIDMFKLHTVGRWCYHAKLDRPAPDGTQTYIKGLINITPPC